MSKEAAPQSELIKQVTAEDHIKSEPAILQAVFEAPKYCFMNSFKLNACETDANGHAKGKINKVLIISFPLDIISDVNSLRFYF